MAQHSGLFHLIKGRPRLAGIFFFCNYKKRNEGRTGQRFNQIGQRPKEKKTTPVGAGLFVLLLLSVLAQRPRMAWLGAEPVALLTSID
ncbi:hypothetical protein LX32DRAFT_273596 [Colletotrichum zoysiae]|uniref:Uncharacterized protein n=1 Tax=Colletotrichum zoysiae TaxID=1216348 RepID=A0AAD9HNS5_9PEZI|nr:hypothetical protein LX32DRAFT_273596 [Colletotrichum zoysiae]